MNKNLKKALIILTLPITWPYWMAYVIVKMNIEVTNQQINRQKAMKYLAKKYDQEVANERIQKGQFLE